MKGKDLRHQFIEAGFEAAVIAVKPDLLDAFWLGRMVEEEFINEVEKQGADICGEKGECHTLVIDGPIFGRGAIKNTNVIRRHEVSFVELLNSDVEEKSDRIKLPLNKKNKERYELS